MAQLTADAFAFGGDLMRVEQALALVAARIPPIAEMDRVAIADADGRVLVNAIFAPIDLPAFHNSAVDGYAVAHADLVADAATPLPVAGRVTAGQIAEHLGARGTTVRIFTGAPMPPGADTVFMQEDVRLLEDGRVELPSGLTRGANCRPRGEDIACGAEALAAGRRLEPRDIALAAALGLSHLEVRRRPRVAVFSTGDELREPGTSLSPAAIYDANRFALTAMLRRSACEVTDLGILADDRDAIQARLSSAADTHDLIVTSGGVSTGEGDHVRAAITQRGSIVFWRLAIKPGRPVAMGVLNGTPIVGLTGNPVAVFVTFAHVLRPLIAALTGAIPTSLFRSTVTAGFSHRKKSAGGNTFVYRWRGAGPSRSPPNIRSMAPAS
jgi:molybdopterin molybdotransferase